MRGADRALCGLAGYLVPRVPVSDGLEDFLLPYLDALKLPAVAATKLHQCYWHLLMFQ